MKKDKVNAIFKKYLGKGIDDERYLDKGLSIASKPGSYVYIVVAKETDVSAVHAKIVDALEYFQSKGFIYHILLDQAVFVSNVVLEIDKLKSISEDVSKIVGDIFNVKFGNTQIHYVGYLSDNIVFNNIFIDDLILERRGVHLA